VKKILDVAIIGGAVGYQRTAVAFVCFTLGILATIRFIILGIVDSAVESYAQAINAYERVILQIGETNIIMMLSFILLYVIAHFILGKLDKLHTIRALFKLMGLLSLIFLLGGTLFLMFIISPLSTLTYFGVLSVLKITFINWIFATVFFLISIPATIISWQVIIKPLFLNLLLELDKGFSSLTSISIRLLQVSGFIISGYIFFVFHSEERLLDSGQLVSVQKEEVFIYEKRYGRAPNDLADFVEMDAKRTTVDCASIPLGSSSDPSSLLSFRKIASSEYNLLNKTDNSYSECSREIENQHVALCDEYKVFIANNDLNTLKSKRKKVNFTEYMSRKSCNRSISELKFEIQDELTIMMKHNKKLDMDEMSLIVKSNQLKENYYSRTYKSEDIVSVKKVKEGKFDLVTIVFEGGKIHYQIYNYYDSGEMVSKIEHMLILKSILQEKSDVEVINITGVSK
jgi:hypothetical protein